MGDPNSLQYAVVEKNNRDHKLFEGDYSRTARWLLRYPAIDDLQIYDKLSNRWIEAEQFASLFFTPAKPANPTEGMTPDEKLHYEDLHDPLIHARNHMILQYIRRCMIATVSTREMDEELAAITTREIIRLFY